MNKLALAFFASLAMAIGVQASTITAGNVSAPATTSSFLTGGDGSFLGAGTGYIGLGVFSIGDDAIAAANGGADFSAVKGGFNQFGNSLTVGFNNLNGLFQGLVSGAISGGDAYQGKNVYAVVGSGSSLAASTELLVFKASATFQADPAPTDNITLNPASGTLLLGSVGSGTFNGINVATYQLAGGAGGPVIPEPSSALLGLLGLGFVAFRRKR